MFPSKLNALQVFSNHLHILCLVTALLHPFANTVAEISRAAMLGTPMD